MGLLPARESTLTEKEDVIIWAIPAEDCKLLEGYIYNDKHNPPSLSVTAHGSKASVALSMSPIERGRFKPSPWELRLILTRKLNLGRSLTL